MTNIINIKMMILLKLWITISLVIGKRFRNNPVTTSTMESCSLGNRRSSLKMQRHAVFLTRFCNNYCGTIFFIQPCVKCNMICGPTCVLKEEQCWMIRCSSSWTSSTQRRLGSSRRLICRFTSSSKDTSGTKSAGRGPCRANIIHTYKHKYTPAPDLTRIRI